MAHDIAREIVKLIHDPYSEHFKQIDTFQEISLKNFKKYSIVMIQCIFKNEIFFKVCVLYELYYKSAGHFLKQYLGISDDKFFIGIARRPTIFTISVQDMGQVMIQPN
jgi:hypothetical protein